MSKSGKGVQTLDEKNLREIEIEVNKRLGEYKRTGQILRDDIFDILEMNARVLYYPIEDDEICAFMVNVRGNIFVYINTRIPLEKQVFAAAHELYHIWHWPSDQLLNDCVLENQFDRSHEISTEELRANRFAAEFLVPKNVLINELDLRNINRNTIALPQILELMDVFLVPYKTMVKRLYEIEYISAKVCEEFLQKPARDEHGEVQRWQKRLGLCKRNNQRTEDKELANLVDMALELYEKKFITVEKMAYLLELEGHSKDEFGIAEDQANLPSEDDILKAMEEE